MTGSAKKSYWRVAARWFGLWGRSFQKLLQDKGLTHSAAIAYYMLFSIFPLLLLSIGLLGFVLDAADTQREVLALVGRYFPTGSLRIVRENIRSIVDARNELSFISVVGLLWAATLMFDAINEAVNAAWGIHQGERFIRLKIKSFLIVLFLLVVVLFSTVLTTQSALPYQFQSFLLQFQWGQSAWEWGQRALHLAGRIVSWGLVIVAFGLTYFFLPRTKVEVRNVWSAAIVAATIWEISKRLFVWYVTQVNYSQVYGSIGAVLVLMIWTFVSALILIWGAEFAAEQGRQRDVTNS